MEHQLHDQPQHAQTLAELWQWVQASWSAMVQKAMKTPV